MSLGLSRTGTAIRHGFSLRLRETLSSDAVIPAVTMPPGKTRLRVACDMTDAHQLDPTRTLAVVVEISDDDVNWRTWCGFTTEGTVNRNTRPGWPHRTQPAMVTDAPPAGVRVRTRISPGAQAVTTGLVTETA